MTGRALAIASLLGIAAVTAWRVLSALKSGPFSTQVEGEAVRRVWAMAALSLIVSILTDLDAELGGYFGLAILVSLLLNNQAAGALTGLIQTATRVNLGAGSGAPPGVQGPQTPPPSGQAPPGPRGPTNVQPQPPILGTTPPILN